MRIHNSILKLEQVWGVWQMSHFDASHRYDHLQKLALNNETVMTLLIKFENNLVNISGGIYQNVYFF